MAKAKAQVKGSKRWGVATWLKDGIAAHQRGDIDAAERHYQRILYQEPTHADALHLSGLVARSRGDAARAAALIRRAIDASPTFALYHVNLGLALADAGDQDGAVAAFERALELDPALPAAAFNLALALEERGELERAAELYRSANRQDSMPEAAFNLGNVLLALKKPEEAVASYRHAAELRPGYARALANLANAHQGLGQFEDAARVYRDLLAVDPTDVEAQHMLAALTGEARDRADSTYVAKFFDDYAARFEQVLVEDLAYNTPAAIAALVERHLPASGRFARAVDLGCGTGLAGRALRARCDRLVGVDLSPKMLEKAREAGGYDELHASDLGEFLRSREAARFDLFVAADVLNYLGDLREVFGLVAACAAPGAKFAFSIEAGDKEGFALERTGRFSHGRGYIETTAKAAGLSIESASDEVLRMERGAPVRGVLFLLSRA